MRLKMLSAALAVVTPMLCMSGDLVVDPEEVKDFKEATGVGCQVEENREGPGIVSIVCRSKKSGDLAWNAVMARSKMRCQSSRKKMIQMLFLKPPSLPVENGIFAAQMDIKCTDS